MGEFLRRRLGLVLAVAVVLVLLSARRIATFVTDLWWFDALGYRNVFTTVVASEVLLAVVFGVALAAIIAVNLWIARRMRPVVVPSNQREAIVERYRQLADPYVPWIILGVAALFGISAGGAVAGQWERFLLWRHGGSFGASDPQFGRDIAFFVFDLPWYEFVQQWLFTSLLLALLVTAGAHYLLGSIRPEAPGEKVTAQAKAHLSVLLALVLAARGWGYWLDRFQLNFSPRGQVTGAAYTDVHAELPALNLLIIATVVAIVLVLYNIRERGWLLPGAAIGLLILASIVLQGIYPTFIQRVRVDPQELQREGEFIGRNMDATLDAWGVGPETPIRRFEVGNDLDQEQVEDNQVTIRNVRLWDPSVLETTYAELQALRPYYRFNDVDVDRYIVDDELRQVMLSSRELEVSGLPPEAQTWQNQRLIYTHGMGTVASQVNLANAEGQPIFLSRDIPPRGNEAITPEVPYAGIYYGEENDLLYSIVSTEQAELDYETPDGSEQVTTSYEGEGGVSTGSLMRRLAFAIRFADPNFVLSGLLRDDSQVLFERDVTNRVRRVAPYLELDDDPYPVIQGERIVWIQDAYTVSNHYPYSERRPFGNRGINYIRNSVKAAVDAYDGTVTLYVVDPDDPMLEAWREAFPDQYVDVSEAPDGLEEHFRYPQDMFTAQALLYRTYHIPDVPAFYSKADAWEVPLDASTIANQPGDGARPPMEPYYLLMRLPGQEIEEFVLIQPYLARDKPNMIAWLAGRSDPEHYGELFAVQFPSDQTILGPQQAQARLEQNDEIAEYITLRDQAGSDVIRGNLLVIPIERSILYVEPLFIESPQARIPQLERVVVVMGERTVMRRTLDAAIAEIVGAGDEVEDVRPGEDPEEVEEAVGAQQIEGLVERALERFAQADEALRDGNLADYQRLLAEARDLLERAIGAGEVDLPEGEAGQGEGEGEGAGAGGEDEGAAESGEGG